MSMNTALWASVTGLDAQSKDIGVISNNIANVGTTGFKTSRVAFQDLAYQNIMQVGAETEEGSVAPTGILIGTGVKTAATYKDFSQGSGVQTGNELDLTINGRGFFQVQRADGTVGYTRDGNFHKSADGQIVNSSGYSLTPAVSSIPNDAQSITIGHDGIVSVTLTGDPQPRTLGTIQLADFINPAGLQPVGENLFIETQASGQPVVGTANTGGLGSLEQGMLEGSNVNIVAELVRMIETQRAWEMNARSVETVDGMLQTLTTRM